MEPSGQNVGQSDIELMLLVKAGDEGAFTILVERYSDRMLSYLYRWVGQREEAEDLAQLVFVNLFTSAKRYEPTAKFTTFLYTIATNVARSELRRAERKTRKLSWDAPVSAEGRLLSEVVADRGASPWKQTLTSERLGLIRKALAELPPELREVFLLSEEQDLSYAEIADILKIPSGTVGSRKYHAVKRLQELLGPLRNELMGDRT